MLEQLKSELKNSKIYIYSVSITVCILSIFGFVIFIASAGDGDIESIPSPSPTDFASILGAKDPNQTQLQQSTDREQPGIIGPERPVVLPSQPPSPKISPSPSSSLTMLPSPSPSVSPSPTVTPTPENNSDTSGPSISEIKSTDVTANKAIIEWNTNEDAEGKIEYGKDTSYGKNKESSDRMTSYSLELTDLEANTTYHYRIISKDSAGNSTTSGDNTFTTLP